MFTAEGFLYFTFFFSILGGLISSFYLFFSIRTLHSTVEDVEVGFLPDFLISHFYYSDDFYFVFAPLFTAMGVITQFTFLTASELSISFIARCIMFGLAVLSGLASILASDLFIGAEFNHSVSNANKVVGVLIYKNLKKTYSSDTAYLIKLLKIKSSVGVSYSSDRVPLQIVLLELSTFVMSKKYSSDDRNRIETALKSTEFIDLSGPLLNILNNAELFAFIRTKKGSESIEDYVEELRNFIDNLKKEVNQVTTIKKNLTEAEMILELENLTKNKLSKDFMQS